jgi:hypothetical protein
MGKDFEPVFAALEQSDRDGRWLDRFFERLRKTHRRRSRSLDPCLMRRLPRCRFG